MKKLLYIRLRENQGFEFGVPEEFREIKEVLDLDNFSDAQTVNYALKFISDSDSRIVIDAEPRAQLGKLLYLFNQLREMKPLDLEIRGEHKMLGFLKAV